MSQESSQGNTEEALRVQQERYAQRVRERLRKEREETDRILNAYREAWAEFYAREPEQCTQLLTSLGATSPRPPRSLRDYSSAYDELDESMVLDRSPSPSSLDAGISIWTSVSQRSSTLVLPNETTTGPIQSYPKYESCTPSLERIKYWGDTRILYFIPYADEPRFEGHIKRFSRRHRHIAWQTEWFDADFKLIASAALLRLEAAGVDAETINRFKPSFLPPLPPEGGVKPIIGKRDLHSWGNDVVQAAHSAPKPSAPATSVLSDVNGVTAVFCPSLTCNSAKCMTHDLLFPPTTVKLPKKTNEEIYSKMHQLCSDSCFKEYSMEYFLVILLFRKFHMLLSNEYHH
ncbi:hypothetical protein C8Q78DRAFT_612595 [Trametes maxima]|nr:hypothetical protein C8Q78DRAFT_612595 [Trametes maxima]